MELVVGAIYEHYKGMRYKALGVVRHSETLEEMALYETLYENKLGKLWVRPLAMFLEEKEPGVPRFRLVEKPQL